VANRGGAGGAENIITNKPSARSVLHCYPKTKTNNPAKWFGSQSQPGASAPMTESSRKIVEGQLQLRRPTMVKRRENAFRDPVASG